MKATMATAETYLGDEVGPHEIEVLAAEFEPAPPEQTLRWVNQEFGSEVALATGFGPEGCVLIDMLSRVDRGATIFYLDYGLHFAETYALIKRLETRYDVSFERISTQLSLATQEQILGAKLWEREPDRCCQLRKVEPLAETLADLHAWITAIRRDQ